MFRSVDSCLFPVKERGLYQQAPISRFTNTMVNTDVLQQWCVLANRAAVTLTGERNNCIAASLALVEYLATQGIEASVFRAEARAELDPYIARIYSMDSAVDTVGCGSRPPGRLGWFGHLAVSCGPYVLDPTLDQLLVDGRRPKPVVFAKPGGWSSGTWRNYQDGDLNVHHRRHDLQIGWKSKPAARRSQYMQVFDLMISLRAGTPDLASSALP